MEEIIKKLKDLAIQWRKLSQDFNGWDTQEYKDGKYSVRCYFADNSDHTSVQFTRSYGFSSRSFEVAFFSPAKFSFCETLDMQDLYEHCIAFYEIEKAKLETLSEKEAEQKKQEKISALKKRLLELEEA